MNNVRGARLVIGLAAAVAAGGHVPRALAAPLVVSLTFDDGVSDDVEAAKLLEARGFKGTFYVISGVLGRPHYLTPAQVRALEAAGHEIGGHTVSHRHLPTLPLPDVQREICNDRTALFSYGLHPRSFAYPFGEYTGAAERLARECGYDSARIVGPIPDHGAPTSEDLPPDDPYAVITPWSVERTMSLAQIQTWVTAAQASGGWLPIVFHQLCREGSGPCDQYGVSVETFTAFLDWLKAKVEKGTVVVKLVRELVGGALRPLTAVANPLINPSLEGVDEVPDGWQRGGSGVHTARWYRVNVNAHEGDSAQRVDLTEYTSGSVQLVPTLNRQAPPAEAGHSYQVSAWYQANVPVRWVLYVRDRDAGWSRVTQSAALAPAREWTAASWTTPAMPKGATGLSFGLSLSSLGSLTVDDFELTDLGVLPAPVAVAAPGSGTPVPLASETSEGPGEHGPRTPRDSQLETTVAALSALAPSASDSTDRGPTRGTAARDQGSLAVLPGGMAKPPAPDPRRNESEAAPPRAPHLASARRRGLQNPGLEGAPPRPGGAPDCWSRAGFGAHGARWSAVSEAHEGQSAQRVEISDFTSGAERLVPTQDSGDCSPPGLPGHRYKFSAWYRGLGPTRWVAYYRNPTGGWVWWAQSPVLAESDPWAQTAFVTPPLPAGATHLSFGLSLYGTGSLTVDDFSLDDLGP